MFKYYRGTLWMSRSISPVNRTTLRLVSKEFDGFAALQFPKSAIAI